MTSTRTPASVRGDVETAALSIQLTLDEADRLIAEADEFVGRLPLLEFVELGKFYGVEARYVMNDYTPDEREPKNRFVGRSLRSQDAYDPIVLISPIRRVSFAGRIPELMEQLADELWKRERRYHKMFKRSH